MSMSNKNIIRGFIFACTNRTEKECFDRSLFGTEKTYGPVAIRIRKGDILFLHNLDTNKLYGIFKAISDGKPNIESDAWKGKYPYQVKIKLLGKKKTLENAKKILNRFKLKMNTPVFGKKLVNFLDLFDSNKLVKKEKEKVKKYMDKVDIEKEIPTINATTLWDFPRQNYGLTPKGDNKYPEK